MKKRDGYSLAQAGAFTDAYATLDEQRMYVVDDGQLKAMTGPASSITLQSGNSSTAMHWTEINEQVFFSNGTDAGVIQPDNAVLPWRWVAPDAPALAAVTGTLPAGLYRVLCTYTLADGRETGGNEPVEITLTEGQAIQISDIPQLAGCATNVYVAPADSTVFSHFRTTLQTALVWNYSPDNLRRDFTNDVLSPLPFDVDVIQAWRGRIYAAQYFPHDKQTAIWCSQPLGFHLFNLAQDFFMVPGRVTMLAPTDDALLIGTDRRVFAYDASKLDELAPYGVIPGQHWSKDDDRILFWTARGLCAALPFVNLTEKQISVAPGVRAGGCLVQAGGQKRYLAVLQQGGVPFNAL
ncbi:hypothetical protein [Rhodoferax ferrireducens]|uniref:hypothetical protein n=1 Tax=Rhodoferax ferrireducens TaxID=192843 RepID=UPI00130060F0|nr:hypothetical protein [Rhodoferax ferrireducens]